MTPRIAERSETYRRALAGERVRLPRVERTALCVDLGRLVERVGVCRSNDLHVCDRFGSVISHAGACQSCTAYVADV
jgi:hypothetical protein